MVNFRDVVDSRYKLSEAQLAASQFGLSEIYFRGSPTVYSPGDVVHLPYTSGETSTIQALGNAWAAYASGVGPA